MLVDLEGHIVLANERARSLLAVVDGIEGLQNSSAWPEIEKRLRSGAPLDEFVCTVASTTGQERSIAITASAWRDASGSLAGARWLLRDVTASQHAEQLRVLLSSIVDSSHDAIVSKQLDGTIMSWNRAAERLFGYTSKEAVGRSIRMIVPADRQAEEDEVLRRLRRGEMVDHFQTVRQRKDGTDVHVSLTISPVRDSHGRIVGASKVARDISEQKAEEDDLRRALAARDEFLGLVSHELRTPLTTLKGAASVLRRHHVRLSDAEREQSLADIEAGSDKMLRIVENMLTLARADNEQGAEMEPVLVGRLASQVVSEQQLVLSTHRLAFAETAEALLVMANAGYARLILTNLLSNAAKYSQPGSTIEVAVRRRGEMAELSVHDSGIGIKPAEQEAVFAPFFRSASTRGEAAGIGLGLTVCKRLAEVQSGSIGVMARREGGTTFTFSLPLLADDGGIATLS